MRIPHSSTLQRDFSVSMTPMIDVVFLLLIFFVCTANFRIAESVLPSPLELDGSRPAEQPSEIAETDLDRVVIEVEQHNNALLLIINEQPCPSLVRLSKLLAALAQVDTTLPILLDIDGETPLGTTIEVYDRCRLAGFMRIQFAAEVK